MGIRFDWMQFWKSHPLVVASIVHRKKNGVPCDNATTIDHDRSRNKAILIFPSALSALEAVLTKQICLQWPVADSGLAPFRRVDDHRLIYGYSTSE
jgi:hypothetical protein